MTVPPHRLLLVGLGNRTATALLPALATAHIPLRPAAVVDPDPATTARVAELVRAGLLPANVTVYADLDKALSVAAYDIAVVAGPHDTHQRAALAVAAAGVVVWKEKPYALSLADARELATLPAPGVRVLAHRPHAQLMRLATALLPTWGRLLSYRIRILRATGDYAHTWRACPIRSGGGAVCDLGYHAFDLIARLVPDAATVYAQTAEPPAHRPQVRVEERAHLLLTHGGGCRGSVELSRCDDPADEVDLVAEHGRITISGRRARIHVSEHVGLTHTITADADDDAKAAMLRHHARTLHDSAAATAEARIGLGAVALMQAAYASLHHQAPAPVPAIPTAHPALEEAS
ncbi:Gfo/Idh/MocA family protein [Spongiactinospora sp. 9N601]|uniref:Gfo/Idh/MocA family protein n=1 Tax=Spongiactinospora sp. 9N601 TaxID=3375149 RepID=UPI00379DCDEB